ncbi:MAG: sigma-54 dependent transcriptional regulator [Melioribacteraceae bacterium]|nr:sigma-54 dependent transcriptional regulator [Melioribacteraceae bacterium]
MKNRILVIDHNSKFSDNLLELSKKDYEFYSAESVEEGIKLIREKFPDLILLDLKLNNGINGIDILKEIKMIDAFIPVIMITDNGSINTAVKSAKNGSENYISKTSSPYEMKSLFDKTIRSKLNKQKSIEIKQEIEKPFFNIVGSSEAVKVINEKINLVAKSPITVLITGESGTGKELVARQIHLKSERSNEVFVAVNCGAIPVNLIESELFGHERGSFTGAVQRQLGKFEIAENGTLFLDEVSELSLDAQVKIMRVLQEKEFERVGGNKTIKTNTRVIAATNKNLKNLVDARKFREDLFYRLDVFPIDVPPLRERKEDIPELIHYLLYNISIELKMLPPKFSNDTVELLKSYDWPGNIRELINYLTRSVILCAGKEITQEMIARSLIDCHKKDFFVPGNISLKWKEMNKQRKNAAEVASRKVEAEFAKKLLEKFDGNVSRAAEYAGINRTNLHKMIKRAGL